MNIPFHIILRGLHLLPQIILLIISIYYFQKKKTSDGLLISIGTFIGLGIDFFYTFMYQYLYRQSISKNSTDIYFYSNFFHNILRLLGFIGSIIVTLGIFILIRKTLKNKKDEDEINKIGY